MPCTGHNYPYYRGPCRATHHHHCQGGAGNCNYLPHGCTFDHLDPLRRNQCHQYYNPSNVGVGAFTASAPRAATTATCDDTAFDTTSGTNAKTVEQLAQVVEKLVDKMSDLEEKLDGLKKN